MALTQELGEEIESYLLEIIDKKLKKYERETQSMPFHYRLLGNHRIATYSFVHSVVTTIGMSVYEQLGEKIANANPEVSKATKHYKLEGSLNSGAILTIDTILRDLRSKNRMPNQVAEVNEILKSMSSGVLNRAESQTVDLFVEKKDGTEFYFDLKTVKPNMSGADSDKRRILEWVALRVSIDNGPPFSADTVANIQTAIAMPYNPYAPEPYRRWTLDGIFDFGKDLLVADEFWNLLGGSSTYQELLDVFELAGLKMYDEIEHRINRIVEAGKRSV